MFTIRRLKCVNKIVGFPNGPSLVQEAMRLDLSLGFMNGMGATVLVYLLRATSVSSSMLNHLFVKIVNPDFFWSAFSHALAHGELSTRESATCLRYPPPLSFEPLEPRHITLSRTSGQAERAPKAYQLSELERQVDQREDQTYPFDIQLLSPSCIQWSRRTA
jgi:hypothetical protein